MAHQGSFDGTTDASELEAQAAPDRTRRAFSLDDICYPLVEMVNVVDTVACLATCTRGQSLIVSMIGEAAYSAIFVNDFFKAEHIATNSPENPAKCSEHPHYYTYKVLGAIALFYISTKEWQKSDKLNLLYREAVKCSFGLCGCCDGIKNLACIRQISSCLKGIKQGFSDLTPSAVKNCCSNLGAALKWMGVGLHKTFTHPYLGTAERAAASGVSSWNSMSEWQAVQSYQPCMTASWKHVGKLGPALAASLIGVLATAYKPIFLDACYPGAILSYLSAFVGGLFRNAPIVTSTITDYNVQATAQETDFSNILQQNMGFVCFALIGLSAYAIAAVGHIKHAVDSKRSGVDHDEYSVIHSQRPARHSVLRGAVDRLVGGKNAERNARLDQLPYWLQFLLPTVSGVSAAAIGHLTADSFAGPYSITSTTYNPAHPAHQDMTFYNIAYWFILIAVFLVVYFRVFNGLLYFC